MTNPNLGSQTSNCPKCGERISNEMKFCPKCGYSLGIVTPTFKPSIAERRIPKGPDVLGIMTAGVILIILAWTYIQHPIEPTEFANYFEAMSKAGVFIKPPLDFLRAVIFFFWAVGAWDIILSVLRVIFERNPKKALEDLVGVFFSFFCAYLITNYAADIFTARATLAYFIIGIGLIVISNALIHYAFHEQRYRT